MSKASSALVSFVPGDHVERCFCHGYLFHHAIVKSCSSSGEGGGKFSLIHFMPTTDSGNKKKVGVSEEAMEHFQLVYRSIEPNTVLARAVGCIDGYSNYHPVFQNCEHFANYCVTGEAASLQVMNVSIMIGSVLTRTVAGPILPLLIEFVPQSYQAIRSYVFGHIDGKQLFSKLVTIASSNGIKIAFAGCIGMMAGAALGMMAGPWTAVALGAAAGVAAANTAFEYLREKVLSPISRNKEEALADAYRKLGVSRDSNLKDINTAFRKLSLEHHPDKGGDAAKFLEITVSIGLIRLAFEEADARKMVKKLREEAQLLFSETEQKISTNLEQQSIKEKTVCKLEVEGLEIDQKILQYQEQLLQYETTLHQMTKELQDLNEAKNEAKATTKETERKHLEATAALNHTKSILNLIQNCWTTAQKREARAQEKLKNIEAELLVRPSRKKERQRSRLEIGWNNASHLVEWFEGEHTTMSAQKQDKELQKDVANEALLSAQKVVFGKEELMKKQEDSLREEQSKRAQRQRAWTDLTTEQTKHTSRMTEAVQQLDTLRREYSKLQLDMERAAANAKEAEKERESVKKRWDESYAESASVQMSWFLSDQYRKAARTKHEKLKSLVEREAARVEDNRQSRRVLATDIKNASKACCDEDAKRIRLEKDMVSENRKVLADLKAQTDTHNKAAEVAARDFATKLEQRKDDLLLRLNSPQEPVKESNCLCVIM